MDKKSKIKIHSTPIPTYLVWADSSGFTKADWREMKETLTIEATPIISIVFIIAEDKHQIWTIGHIATFEGSKTIYHGDMVIPKCAIIKRKKIKL